jgi:adenylate cyclase
MNLESRTWTLQRIGGIAFLWIPLLAGLVLGGKFLSLSRQAVEDDAYRLLLQTAEELVLDYDAARALRTAFNKTFPAGFKKIDVGAASLTVQNLCDSFQQQLGIPTSAVRVLVFDPGGHVISQTQHFPAVDRQESLWQSCYIALGSGNNTNARGRLAAQKARELCLELYQGRVTLIELEESEGFDGTITWGPGSMTHFLRKRLGGREGENAGILVEVDSQSISAAGQLKMLRQNLPITVSCFFLARPDGSRVYSLDMPVSMAQRTDPVPAADTILEAHDRMFLVKRSLGGGRGALVVGMKRPWISRIPNSLLLMAALVFAFLGGALAMRLENSIGTIEFRSPNESAPPITLTRKIGILFGMASLIPLLSLGFFGAVKLMDSRKAQEIVWTERMQRHLAGYDRLFHQKRERLQHVLNTKTREFAEVMEAGKSLRSRLVSRGFNNSYVMAADGRLFVDRETWKIHQSGTADFVKSQLKPVLAYKQALLNEGKAPAAFGKTTMSVESLIMEDTPLREMVVNEGKIRFFEFLHYASNAFFEFIHGEGGRLHGVHFVMIDFKLIAARFARNLPRQARAQIEDFRVGVKVWNDFLPARLASSPAMFDLLEKTQQYKKARAAILEYDGKPVLAVTYSPSFLEVITLGAWRQVAPMEQETRRRIAEIVLILGVVFSIIVLGALLVKNLILHPLDRLKQAARDISAGHLGKRLTVDSGDEFGRLAHSFNAMAEGMQQKERMKRFVAKELWEKTERGSLESEQSRRLTGAVLFSDIRGFTTLSETMPPDAVIAMLNEYFTAMDRVIRLNHGEINKLIGDAILAVFRPLPGKPDPSRRAVTAGLAMRAALSHFNHKRRRQGLFEIENGVGIHYGSMIEGKIGGAGGLSDFAVLGQTVSRALLLEGFSKQGKTSKVIVSAETAAALGGYFPLVPLLDEAMGVAGETVSNSYFEVDRPWSAHDEKHVSDSGKPSHAS